MVAAILVAEAAMPTTVKDEMRTLLERLPDDVSWERLADAVELRRKIARGLADADAGRISPHEEVRRELGLAE